MGVYLAPNGERRMKLVSLIFIAPSLYGASVLSAPMWEAGELHYPQDQSEVSAFVNTRSNTQLQTVLCAKNTGYAYRFTLLLPKLCENDLVIEVWVKSDTLKAKVYAEVSGNSLEFQTDQNFIISLADSPLLTFEFEKDDADYLGVPEILNVPMTGSDLTMRKVASECTALCLHNGYQCNKPLVSSVLWPAEGFKRQEGDINYDALCTKIKDGHYVFLPGSEDCRFALDRFYAYKGRGPLSFLEDVFNGRGSHFKKYEKLWNDAVAMIPGSMIIKDTKADGREWYLTLYSLAGSNKVADQPQSYFDILNQDGDPTTLIYDKENRYELEALKYTAVLLRRVGSSLNARESVEEALKEWTEFYREFSSVLPSSRSAQALRPLIYRTMLLRVWRAAGQPEGVSFKQENAFVQGKDGKLSRGDRLEAVCSFFDGEGGNEFFFGSDECVKGVAADLNNFGFATSSLKDVYAAWDHFAAQWTASDFYSDTPDDAVGINLRSKLCFSLLSLYRTYGFGDYFLLRQSIASRDPDISDYETEHTLKTYENELETRISAISQVNTDDAAALSRISRAWNDYYLALGNYVDDLCKRGIIPAWRAYFVKGTALLSQLNALLNLNYDHDEWPDESLENADLD